jgi:hypothetical protein
MRCVFTTHCTSLVSATPDSKSLSVQPLKEVRVRMAEHDLQLFNQGNTPHPNHNFEDLTEELRLAREDLSESDHKVNIVKHCTL